ncbi:hypothetical protein ACWV95_13535 [Streptomyces albus]
MALPRALLSGLTAVLTVCGLAVDSSTAADRGHAPTRAALETVVERDRVPGAVARVEDGAGPWEGAARGSPTVRPAARGRPGNGSASAV